MSEYKNSSISLKDEQKEKLIKMAEELEIFVTRGPGVGRVGSISGLLQSIADGDVKAEKVKP